MVLHVPDDSTRVGHGRHRCSRSCGGRSLGERRCVPRPGLRPGVKQRGVEGDTDDRSIYLRSYPDPHRPLWRRAVGRADRRSRRDPDHGAPGTQREPRSRADRGRRVRLRQPGRRRQPQRCAHGRVACGSAGYGSGRHGKPPLWVRDERGRQYCRRRQDGRHRTRDCGRSRVDVACAVRPG